MINIKKISLQHLALIFLIFLPKYTILSLGGFVQGIRLEDFLVLIIGIINFNKYCNNKNNNSLNIVFFYIFFIVLLNYLIGINQELIILLRIIEYWVIYNFIYFNHKYINIKLITLFILLNCGVAFLQFYGLLGGFASYGYLESGHGFLGRPYGMLAGPWELGVTLCISLLILRSLEINLKYQIILNSIVLITLMLCATRSVIIGYIIVNLYIYRKKLKDIKSIIYILLLILSMFLIDIIELLNIRFDNIVLIFNKIINYYSSDLKLIHITDLDISLSQRYSLWNTNLNLWQSSIFNMLFGIGWHSLYMESFLIRVLTTFGIFGVLLLIYLYRDVKFTLILLTIIVGTTLDLFVSMKIFIFYSLYSSVIQNNNNEDNNIRA